MQKIVAQIDVDGFLCGIQIADPSPLEDGVYLIPSGCIDQEPPASPLPGMRYKHDGAGGWIEEPIPQPEPPPPLTAEQLIASYESALDAHLDAVAQQHRYRDRVTFAMRAGYPGPWQSEGAKFGTWMDTCNAQAYALLQSVLDGETELPSKDDFVASLPPFVLP